MYFLLFSFFFFSYHVIAPATAVVAILLDLWLSTLWRVHGVHRTLSRDRRLVKDMARESKKRKGGKKIYFFFYIKEGKRKKKRAHKPEVLYVTLLSVEELFSKETLSLSLLTLFFFSLLFRLPPIAL